MKSVAVSTANNTIRSVFGKTSSMRPIPLENRLTILPLGFESKNRVCSHDVMSAILEERTIKSPPYWRSKLILLELNSFVMQILSFVSINKYDSWSHVRTHSIVLVVLSTGRSPYCCDGFLMTVFSNTTTKTAVVMLQ